jgi:hypothetical protein
VKALALVVMLAFAGSALADDDEPAKQSYRAVVDRVDLEPSTLTGQRLRVYLSALALQGQLLDLTDPKTIKLYIGSSEKKLPYSLGRYGATNGETAVVIMVQASLDFTDTLPMISEALDRDLLVPLPDRTQVAVMTYGETTGSGKLVSIKQARGKVALAGDSSAGDPALLDTLDRALMALKRAKTNPEGRTLRKVVIVVGDGRDVAGDRDRVTRTGKRAAREGVRIHTLAYSANDVRRPMLALGELSKQSLGTFRWVRKATSESWKAAFEQLRDEITQQYVLTFFTSASDEVAGKKLHIVTVGRTEAKSNELKIPAAPMCGTTECTSGYCANDKCMAYSDEGGRGVLGWILLIGGILLGAAFVLGVIGYIMSKRHGAPKQPVPGPHAAPGVPQPGVPQPGVPQPGRLPNGRAIPVLVIASGPRRGERYPLFNGFLIGKQPGCNLQLVDGYTSSQHAQVGMDVNGNCKIYDRGSTNGTHINGVRITESALTHGLTIRIGETDIMFLAE